MTLFRDTWEDHIVHPDSGHDELRGHVDWVARTIEQPDAIYRDADHATRRCYYKSGLSRFPRYPLVKVVVQEPPADTPWVLSEVRTAFLVSRAKDGEVLIWKPQ